MDAAEQRALRPRQPLSPESSMAKGQHLSKFQQGIVNRYYEHADTLSVSKLSELVSELAVATSPKAADKLWSRVEQALSRAGTPPARASAIVPRATSSNSPPSSANSGTPAPRKKPLPASAPPNLWLRCFNS